MTLNCPLARAVSGDRCVVYVVEMTSEPHEGGWDGRGNGERGGTGDGAPGPREGSSQPPRWAVPSGEHCGRTVCMRNLPPCCSDTPVPPTEAQEQSWAPAEDPASSCPDPPTDPRIVSPLIPSGGLSAGLASSPGSQRRLQGGGRQLDWAGDEDQVPGEGCSRWDWAPEGTRGLYPQPSLPASSRDE